MVQNLPKRAEVNINETWNLNDLFQNEDEYNQAIAELGKEVESFHNTFKGNIVDLDSIQKALVAYASINEKMIPIGTYADLALSVDQTNTEAQMRASHFGSISARIQSTLSFVDSELSVLPIDVLEEAMKASPPFENYLKHVIRQKEYQLHPEAEKTLAALSTTFEAPYELYNTTKMVDLSFDDFVVNDKNYPLSYVSFEGDWESEPDTKLRRAAFESFSNQIKKYEHTTAKTYDMHVQNEKTMSEIRGYESIFDYLLFDQEVDREMHDRQIDLVMKELAPHMRKYAKLLKKVHGLDKLTFADLKVPLDPTYEPKVSIEQSKNYIDEALSIMGEEYIEMVDRAYKDRWIDFAQNTGKSTGAFCASPYGNHSYILISWTGSMEDVFVLAHELGHAGHFHYTHQNQNVFNSDPSLYFIEAPSTLNEMLVANQLLTNSDDPKFKRWVISSIVARTYYHNFVTHLLEAAYQKEVYERIDKGENVNADILNDIKRNVLQEFWGDEVELTKGAELTWMRQPHYYMGLYPYTYSAGLTISTQVAKRIFEEGTPTVNDWLNVLKAGGTKPPQELAQMAGVDITTEKPLRDTIAYIGELIDQLITLTEEIEA